MYGTLQRFLLRRLLLTIVTLWLVSILIFFMARISGDPTTLLIDDYASASTRKSCGRPWAWTSLTRNSTGFS